MFFFLFSAPSILITFINMVLFKSEPVPEDKMVCSPYMFTGQKGLQTLLVLGGLLCIPWMLFAKPLYIMRGRKEAAVSLFKQKYSSKRLSINIIYIIASSNRSSTSWKW